MSRARYSIQIHRRVATPASPAYWPAASWMIAVLVLAIVMATGALVVPAAYAQMRAGVAAPDGAAGAGAEADLPILRLDDLLRDVRAENPTLRASYLEARALETRRRQVTALPDPTVMVMYQPRPYMGEFRVEQMFPYPGKLGLQGDIAELGAEVAGYEAETLEQDLITQTKILFYDLYRIQEQTVLLRDFRARLGNFEQIASTQYEVGTGAQQAILKAQVEKNTATQRLIELDERRNSILESLSRLANRPIGAGAPVAVSMPDELLLDTEELVAIANAYRPEVDALRVAERRARKQIDLGRRQFMPDFGLSLTYFDVGSSGAMASGPARDAIGVGVSVKVPLQRDRVRAQIEEAQVRVTQVQARQEALQSSFSTQIADLTNQMQREFEQVELYRDVLLPQAETNVEASLSAYTTGRTDFLNLLDSERMLFQIRMGFEEAYARYLKAAAALERQLGIESLTGLDLASARPEPSTR